MGAVSLRRIVAYQRKQPETNTMTGPKTSMPWFARHLWLTLGVFVVFAALDLPFGPGVNEEGDLLR